MYTRTETAKSLRTMASHCHLANGFHQSFHILTFHAIQGYRQSGEFSALIAVVRPSTMTPQPGVTFSMLHG
jgi:hypothetical protein